jgi:hypothetical protein
MNTQLIDVRKIWEEAPHNALTDLIRFRDLWYCVFREGTNHVSPDGRIRILVSPDGLTWSPRALLSLPDADLRDPKITITPDGRAMLNAAAAYSPGAPRQHQSLVWFSRDGTDWGTPVEIGDANNWLWRVTWHERVAYAVGYCTVDQSGIRLYSSRDGARFELLADKLFDDGFPNEASLVFLEDHTVLCLLRRDQGDATARLGSARPPYTVWEWKDLGVRIGGPHLLPLSDGRLVAAVRRYGKNPWTSLNWLDPARGELSEFQALPSGGDTSYAGLYWHEDILWVSYYSSHERRTSIYLARLKL